MKETILKVYKAGGEPFPSADNQIEIGAFTYDARRMGSAPSITATVMHSECLDAKWSSDVYVEFNKEKFFVDNTPSSSYSKSDARYKHSVTFRSERSALDDVYFTNAGRKEFQFFGSLHTFVSYINDALSALGYTCTIDEGQNVEELAEQANFEVSDMYITEALQKSFELYKIPYYFIGKDIHFGATTNAIPEPVFEYGVDNQLVSVSRNNANHKIVTRIFGHGSEENLPYYYPNESSTGEHEVTVTKGDFTVPHIDYDALDRYTNLREGETLTWHDKDVVAESFLKQHVFTAHCKQDGNYIGEKNWFDDLSSDTGSFTHKFNYATRTDKSITLQMSCKFYVVKDRKHYIDTILASSLENGDEISETKASSIWFDKKITFQTVLGESGNYSRISFVPTFTGDVTINFLFNLSSAHKWISEVDTNHIAHFNATYVANIQRFLKYEPFFSLTKSGKDVYVSKSGVDIEGTIKEGDIITISKTNNWINPSKYLMPSIYRESKGATSYYDAINDPPYKDGEGKDISFNNIVNPDRPKEHTQNYEDIKPEIKGMTNASGQAIDMFSEFAYDEDDNDETITNEDGSVEYKHPYFFGKLRKFDGEFGFNLFAHADEDAEMTISMTSGACGGCNFVIGVDDNGNNTVQVDETGNLVRDNGRVKIRGDVQAKQQDTRNNEVWIALKKEENSFGEIRPSASFKPKEEKDTFVITNIQLPQAFIVAAEKRLSAKLIDFMKTNNEEKFNFAIKFSRIYLAEHPKVLSQLDENARLQVKYNGVTSTFYVSSFVYKKTNSNDALPEMTVELTDTLVIGQNAIARAVSQAKSDILSSIEKTDFFVAGNKYFLRKDVDDTASGRISLTKGADARDVVVRDGVTSESFSQNTSGLGITRDTQGNWTIEADFINARKKFTASVFEIQKMQHTGGVLMLTSASMTCVRVEDRTDAYRCYFNAKDSDDVTINQEFVVGDQACCRTYNKNTNRAYWRLVTAVSTTIDEDMLWIDLSKNNHDGNSDIPAEGDTIVQFGYQGNEEAFVSRQNAIVIYGSGEGSPSIVQYKGINSFSLVGKEQTRIQPDNNLFTGKMVLQAGSSGLKELEEWKDLQFGGSNMLRNSGFTGDYLSRSIEDESVLDAVSEMDNPKDAYWTSSGSITVQEETHSLSRYCANVTQDLRQVLQDTKLVKGESYTISFNVKGKLSNFQLGNKYGKGYSSLVKENEYTFFYETITITEDVSDTYQAILFVGESFTIFGIKLEAGNVPSVWSPSTYDNASSEARYKSLEYLNNTLQKGKTEINGGLLLGNVIELGNVGDTDTTSHNAGISGINNINNDVAFWGGGTLRQAINCVNLYEEKGATYQPSEEELKDMAKFIVTHGGRAILEDAIVRGTIYAESGVFNGEVNANAGKFENIEATDSKFTGEVNAKSGKIGGLTIQGGDLFSENKDLAIYMIDNLKNRGSFQSKHQSSLFEVDLYTKNGFRAICFDKEQYLAGFYADCAGNSYSFYGRGNANISAYSGQTACIKGMSNRCRKVSTSTTLDINDDYIIATTSGITLTLPTVSFNLGGDNSNDDCKVITILSTIGRVYVNAGNFAQREISNGESCKFICVGGDEWYLL